MNYKRLYLHHQQDEAQQKWMLIPQDQLVLDALLANGVAIKKACKNGACGVCLTPLLAGKIDYANKIPHGLNEKEKQNGYFLPCIAKCKTDIHIGLPKVALR